MIKIIISKFPFLFDYKIQTHRHSMSFVEICNCMKTGFYVLTRIDGASSAQEVDVSFIGNLVYFYCHLYI